MSKWIAVGLFAWARLAFPADIPAVVDWSQKVELSTPVSGVVQTVRVDVGERVKKGQALLKLDPGIYRARVAESEAVVARLKEELAEAKRDLDRVQELYNRTVISTSELDQAKLQHSRAAARLKEAQAQLEERRKDLADTVLRAPFDAVVLARLAEPGQRVATQLKPQPLLVVARAGEMLARFKVDVKLAQGLKPGAQVRVKVGDAAYPGRIARIGLEPDAGKTGPEYPAAALFQVPQILPSGLPAVVVLP